jgi:hypothetical protein
VHQRVPVRMHVQLEGNRGGDSPPVIRDKK